MSQQSVDQATVKLQQAAATVKADTASFQNLALSGSIDTSAYEAAAEALAEAADEQKEVVAKLVAAHTDAASTDKTNDTVNGSEA